MPLSRDVCCFQVTLTVCVNVGFFDLVFEKVMVLLDNIENDFVALSSLYLPSLGVLRKLVTGIIV